MTTYPTFETRVSIVWWLAAVWILLAVPAGADTPQVALDWLETAEGHREAGRVDQAIDSYRKALEIDASLGEAHAALGALFHSQGLYEEAYNSFRAGLVEDSGDRGLLYNTAVLALRLERLDDALHWVDRALANQAEDGELQSLRAAVLQRLDRPEEALESLQRAAELQQKDPQVWYRLGNLHYQLEGKEQAVEAFRQAVRVDRDFLRAYYNLGAVLFELGRDAEALDAYEVALEPIEKAFASGEEVESLHARAFANLGAIYLRRKDWRSAEEAYEKAERLEPDDPSILYNRAYALFQLSEDAESRRLYERALELGGTLPSVAYLQLARMAAKRQDHPKVISRLEETIHTLEDLADQRAAWRLLAVAQQEQGQSAQSEQSWNEVLRRSPEDRPALLALGRLQREAGRIDEARTTLERARGLKDDLAVGVELARVAQASGDRAAERKLYESLLAGVGAKARQRPEYRAVQLNLVLTLLQQGDLTAARTWLEPLTKVKERSSDPSAQALLQTVHGLLLIAEGDAEGARQKLVAARDFDPAADALDLLNLRRGEKRSAERIAANQPKSAVEEANIGQALWMAGRFDQALPLLQSAAGELPEHLSSRWILGKMAVERGELDQAITWYESTIKPCQSETAPSVTANGARFELMLGSSRETRRILCNRVRRELSTTLARRSYRSIREETAAGRASAAEDAGRALALDPDPATKALAFLVRGTVLAAEGSLRRAQDDLQAALQGVLEPELKALVRNNLATVQFRRGDFLGVERTLGRGSSNSPKPQPLMQALLLDRQGRAEEALPLYESVLAEQPERRDIRARIEQLREFY